MFRRGFLSRIVAGLAVALGLDPKSRPSTEKTIGPFRHVRIGPSGVGAVVSTTQMTPGDVVLYKADAFGLLSVARDAGGNPVTFPAFNKSGTLLHPGSACGCIQDTKGNWIIVFADCG